MNAFKNYRAHKKKLQYCGGFAVGALLAAFGFWASYHGANAGHLVTFLGGLCGTALAVTAAVRIETWKRRLDKQDKYLSVLEYVKELNKNLLFYHSREVKADDDVLAQISLTDDYMGAFLEWSEGISKSDVTDFNTMRYLFWARKTGKIFADQLQSYEKSLFDGGDEKEIYMKFRKYCKAPTHSISKLIESLEKAGKL